MKKFTLLLLTIWTLLKCSICIAQVQDCPFMGDYDQEIRETNPRIDGYFHVNTPLLIQRLVNAKMNGYMYLIQHSPETDWTDFVNEFMPAAQNADLNIWVYLVPPSEGGPTNPYDTASGYSIDSAYVTWAKAIAIQANNYSNIKGFVIDDFDGNLSVFTPSFVIHMMQEARTICPFLTFDVINYYEDITLNWVFDYANCIDGIVFPYVDLDSTTNLLPQIKDIQLLLNHVKRYYQISYPWSTTSTAGDYAKITFPVTVNPASTYSISFSQNDDFAGPTAGYHYKRFLVDTNLIWSEDVAGDSSQIVTLDLTSALQGKSTGSISFELYEQQGVGNFGVVCKFFNLSAENFSIDTINYQRDSNNTNFSISVLNNTNTKKLSLISMIYANPTSWHPIPPTVNYVQECLSISHQAILDSLADGIVTYCLDKSTDTSSYYVAVQDLYAQWRCSTGVQFLRNAESLLIIYPNPANSKITIESQQHELIEISNIQGQLIKTLAIKGNKTNVDISTFPSGVYIIKAKTDEGIAVKKLIKQ